MAKKNKETEFCKVVSQVEGDLNLGPFRLCVTSVRLCWGHAFMSGPCV